MVQLEIISCGSFLQLLSEHVKHLIQLFIAAYCQPVLLEQHQIILIIAEALCVCIKQAALSAVIEVRFCSVIIFLPQRGLRSFLLPAGVVFLNQTINDVQQIVTPCCGNQTIRKHRTIIDITNQLTHLRVNTTNQGLLVPHRGHALCILLRKVQL